MPNQIILPELAMYLPWGLKIKVAITGIIEMVASPDDLDEVNILTVLSNPAFKPIVRPMSDFNGSDAQREIIVLCGFDITEDWFTEITRMPFYMIQILCKHHFDVYSWLDKGMAININEI